MSTIRRRANGTFEMRVVHRLLPKPFYSTHDSEAQAKEYAGRLIAALDRGQVPPELQAKSKTVEDRRKLSNILRDYLNAAPIAASDRPMVVWLQENLGVTVHGLTVRWVDDWVRAMKRVEYLAPGTIRKRVESLARAVDWWQRQSYQDSDAPSNPLRTLPRGYSTYGEGDVAAGRAPRQDRARDRRLAPGEQEAIELAIQGSKRADRQRGLATADAAAFLLLFRLIVATGLRLREAYSLRGGDVRPLLRTIHVARSKTGRARDVPMSPQVLEWLRGPFEPDALIFPFWDGDPESLDRTSQRLSARFKSAFEYARCADLTEHDLRHEAVCRWMEMQDSKGAWLYRAEEVRRITGHQSARQFERYLSLRGSDLAQRMYAE
jgi:integrase